MNLQLSIPQCSMITLGRVAGNLAARLRGVVSGHFLLAEQERRLRALSGSDLEWLWNELAHAVRREQPLTDALRDLAAATQDTSRGQASRMLADSIQEGKPLSAAVASHPKMFPHYAAPAIEAGERAGRLSEVLHSLGEVSRVSGTLRYRLISAMLYPFVLGLMALGLLAFIHYGLTPAFGELYTELGAWSFSATQRWETIIFLLKVECFVLLLGPMFFLTLLYIVPVSRLPRWLWLERLRIRMPMLGKVHREICLWRWCVCMRLLVAAAVPEPVAVALAGRAAGNDLIEKTAHTLSEDVASGKRLCAALEERQFVAPIVGWMIRLSDERGGHSDVWDEVVSFYRETSEMLTDSRPVKMEAVLILVAGQIAGASVVVIFQPMIQLLNSMGG